MPDRQRPCNGSPMQREQGAIMILRMEKLISEEADA